jgi:hypothetical protein
MASERVTELVGKLTEVLDRRQEEYFKIANDPDTDAEHTVSFTARAAETGVFITDLEILLEHLDESQEIAL